MLYLAPFVGSGSYAAKDGYRPRGVDGIAGWARIAFHQRGRTPTADDRCLVWTPDAQPITGEGQRVTQLLADETESLSRALGTRLETDLGIADLSRANNGAALLKELLFGRTATRWNGVVPTRGGLKEVWLAGRRWAFETVEVSKQLGIDPTDNFNRANETPLASPWTRLTGGSGNINLASNAITASAAGDKFYYYSGAASGGNHFSEISQNSAVTEDDWGPAVRIGENGLSGYWFSQYHQFGNDEAINCLDGGSFTSVATANLTDIANGVVCYIEISGSSITCKRNGATSIGPTTDTLLAGNGNGPGVFLYQTGGALDNWQGGDLGGGGATAGGAIIGPVENCFGGGRTLAGRALAC